MFNQHTVTISRFDQVKWPASHFMANNARFYIGQDELEAQLGMIREMLKDPEINPEWQLYVDEGNSTT